MRITGDTLFAFVDPRDPFTPSDIAGEELPGPILSLLAARRFDSLLLFHTPHTESNAELTAAEVRTRFPQCALIERELPISDPKDYSSVMGSLAREVRQVTRASGIGDEYICVSSGTAEMRAAWIVLAAAGVLRGTLLQLGSPAEPLFGAANVKEVYLDGGDWSSLRDLIMPLEYFASEQAAYSVEREELPIMAAAAAPPRQADDRTAGLDDALQELGIYIGSAVMRQQAEIAAIVAGTDWSVLITGETGTGKDVFARLVHRMSERRDGPMIAVNCAAIPNELAESHLFGHLKGSFTGAHNDQKGKFAAADGGTLFLDEIGELSPELQAKLLRVIEDHRVEPIGSSKPVQVDVRIIAATNRDLQREIHEGRFRDDLYYRLLEVEPIRLAPLRERRAEIPYLAIELLRQINQGVRKPRALSKAALAMLQEQRWRGNVRELRSVLKSSVLFAPGDVIEPEDLKFTPESIAEPASLIPPITPGFSLEAHLAEVKRQIIQHALEACGGNQSAAAKKLGCSKQAISKFMQSLPDNAG